MLAPCLFDRILVSQLLLLTFSIQPGLNYHLWLAKTGRSFLPRGQPGKGKKPKGVGIARLK